MRTLARWYINQETIIDTLSSTETALYNNIKDFTSEENTRNWRDVQNRHILAVREFKKEHRERINLVQSNMHHIGISMSRYKQLQHFAYYYRGDELVGQASFVQDTPSTLFIGSIAIVSNWRNHGYGQSLLQAIINYATSLQLSSISLLVGYDNVNAIHIYKKAGFEIQDTHAQMHTMVKIIK